MWGHTQVHDFGQIGGSKPHHDGISITIDNFSVMRMSIRNTIFAFHLLWNEEVVKKPTNVRKP